MSTVEVEAAATNMVFFAVNATSLTAAERYHRFLLRGVRIGATGRCRMRAVARVDVTREQVEQTAGVLADVVLDGPHAA